MLVSFRLCLNVWFGETKRFVYLWTISHWNWTIQPHTAYAEGQREKENWKRKKNVFFEINQPTNTRTNTQTPKPEYLADAWINLAYLHNIHIQIQHSNVATAGVVVAAATNLANKKLRIQFYEYQCYLTFILPYRCMNTIFDVEFLLIFLFFLQYSPLIFPSLWFWLFVWKSFS